MSAHFPVVALAAALAAIPTIVRGSEEEWRWRVFESGNGLGLYILESDEVATDALGAHRVHCRPGSGRIQAENVMGRPSGSCSPI